METNNREALVIRVKQSLEDPKIQDLLLQELFLPLINAFRDPNSELSKLFKAVGEWLMENGPALIPYMQTLQKADARADQLLEQMKKMSLKEFIALEPIDPYTLLIFVNKLNDRAEADARYGRKMREGRKPGAIGSLTKVIARYLHKNSTASAKEIWNALAKKPPRGMGFMDSPRLGKYIEYFDKNGLSSQPDTSYRRFQNIVSEQRRHLKLK